MNRSALGTRAAAAGRDLRALGAGAPIRAGLEVAKRVGGHGVVFGRLAKATGDGLQGAPQRLVMPWSTPAVDTIPASIRDQTRRHAETIADGTVELFGQSIHVGSDPDWHATIDGPDHWPSTPWWKIDIRSDVRTGDVKWAWELGRHHHLVVLARAAFLEPNDPRWSRALDTQLQSWLLSNPPEMGIHWYSNLEIALRSIAWLQILALAGDQLPPARRLQMEATLYHHGRHLLADLPYTISTMRNNHLVGDALGLAVLGRCFPNDRRAQRWQRIGDRVLDWQLRTQLLADGSMIEDSLSYHRFVLEMLAVRVLLTNADGREDSREDLLRSARFLTRLGVLDGEVPRHGDSDEGRVLTSTGPIDDFSGSVSIALALAGSGADDSQRSRFDECAWYTNAGVPARAEPAESHGHTVGGGIARATVGPFTVWLKAGGGPSHGHADLCSTTIRTDDGWVLGDPGTGTYNGPIEQRNYFRSSIAHNVTRLDELDQLEPHRAFRWRYPAVGAIGTPIELPPRATAAATAAGSENHEAAIVMWGWHGSYRRLDPSRRVVRAVVIDANVVTVADWIEGPAGIGYKVSFPLPPDIRDATAEPRRPTLSPPSLPAAHRGETDPFDGWWSPVYGAIEPATRQEISGFVDGPIMWSVDSSPDPAAPSTNDPSWQVDGDRLVRDDIGIVVDWRDTVVRLRVEWDGGDAVAAAATAP